MHSVSTGQYESVCFAKKASCDVTIKRMGTNRPVPRPLDSEVQ